jgi:hypothetical protein
MNIHKLAERMLFWFPIGVPVVGAYVMFMTPGPPPPHLVIAELLLFPVGWYSVCWLVSRLSGWQRLASVYSAHTPPSGRRFHTAGKLGMARYKGCLYVYVASEGLFLSVMSVFRAGHKPLFVPWTEIHNRQAKTIFWREGVEFDIGRPCVATMWLPKKIFENQSAVA